ncbi:hypothetical protein SAMN05444274_11531 [Mariniphaga anaerophila]|uniref:Uncharacterized protein n=1 Tax=Mariniphaga anaerophila TaxID=1484053 RepID=A0A1M5FWQ3_9BACT|nr:hypothetical protein [Mariniphaga anaerophila]SHF96000.1 hypothetical protein SAMN05444274_11531 [Mariniphaga anaerophila]
MSQLATIFARIKSYFEQNIISEGREEDYKFFFPLFSLGYTNEDFLFLNTEMASEDARKYYDELYDFSLMANNIPRQDIIWQLSGENRDFLHKVYEEILANLKLIDAETISVPKLVGTAIFERALNALPKEETEEYRTFYALHKKLNSEILELLKKGVETGDASVTLEVEMKQNMKVQLLEQWKNSARKDEVEQKIEQLLKTEADRFIKKLNEVKGKLTTAIREHVNGSFCLTTCYPNNLYNSDKLAWKKIEIGKDEIQKLVENSKEEGFYEIFELSGLQDLEVEKISFDLIFINIMREWFDEQLLLSPFWDIDLLDKEKIEIPFFATQLVFVRNIEIKLRENSAQNNLILQKMDVKKSIGPFLLNKKLFTANTIQLKSVNKTMQLERNAIIKAKPKVAAVKTDARVLNAVNLRKTRSLVLNANPKVLVRNNPAKTVVAKPQTASFLVAKPVVARAILLQNLVSLTLYFRHKETRQLIEVEPGELEVFRNNKKENVSVKKNDNKTLTIVLSANQEYNIKLVAKGLEPAELKIVFNPQEQKAKRARRFAYTMPKQSQEGLLNAAASNEFQLVAVVCKRIPAGYPAPVPYADYF